MRHLREDYIKGLLEHDEKLIKQIYQRYYTRIEAFVKNNNGTSNDAWEIFQEGLILIFKKIQDPNFQLSSSFYTFLYGICRNLWRNELQKKYRQEVTLEDVDTYTPDDTILSIITTATKKALFKEKFNELGNRCQELLRLFLEKQLKLKTIAAQMGYASENAAKKQKHKCQQQLIKKIKADARYKELL